MRSRFVLQLASHVPVLILGTWQIVTWEARTAGQGTDQLLRRARWAARNATLMPLPTTGGPGCLGHVDGR